MRRKYFGNAKFYKDVLFIAIPVMGHMFVTTLVAIIDSFMVAQLGDIKMSGVNISNQIFFIVQIATSSLATAGGIFLSQYSGAKQKEGMQQAFRFKILMLFFVATASMIFIFSFSEQLLFAMAGGNKNASEIVPYGKQYLNIILFTFIPFAFSTAISTSLRETGSPRLPFIIAIIAASTNAIGNYALIYGNFGAPRLEVIGAAYATLFAKVLELVLLLIVSYKKDFFVSPMHIFKVNLKVAKEIIKRSSWLLLADLTWAFSETMINAVYNGMGGSEVVSGMSAGWTISDLFFLTHLGLGTSITVIIGGLLGQNKLEEAREKARWFIGLSIIVGIVVGIIEALSSLILVPFVFGNLSYAAQTVAIRLLIVVAVYLPAWTLTNAQYYILLAGGDSFSMSIIDTSINVIVSIPLAFLLSSLTGIDPVALYAIIKIVSLIKPILTHFALKKETWIKNLTSKASLKKV